MSAYYNEFDPAAAHVLRHMIEAGVIAPGIVDTRSIKEVQPDDLIGFTQCHFFAGGGLWSVAARMAGWPDDEPLWTGSCPCQPFSAAGKGGGTDDPRHLWPDFHRLIRARRPSVVMGEQVAGAAGYGWFDGVRADLAREDYASRSVDFPSCSVDAPHQRNRQYWLALADCAGKGRVPSALAGVRGEAQGERPRHGQFERLSGTDGADASGVTLGDAFGSGLEGHAGHGDGGGRPQQDRPVAEADVGEFGALADHRSEPGQQDARGAFGDETADGRTGWLGSKPNGDHRYHGHDEGERRLSPDAVVSLVQGQPSAGQQSVDQSNAGLYADADRGGRAGWQEGAEWQEVGRTAPERPVLRNGTYWSDADWIVCHDGKARRAQSGIRFLVDGLPGRVDLWRIGGNAIVPQAAQEVIASFIDVYGLPTTWRVRP